MHRLTFKVLRLLSRLTVGIKHSSDYGSRKHQHPQTNQDRETIRSCAMQGVVE
jgi:hypothetical protein